jgi:hypothetical protein
MRGDRGLNVQLEVRTGLGVAFCRHPDPLAENRGSAGTNGKGSAHFDRWIGPGRDAERLVVQHPIMSCADWKIQPGF